MLIFASSNNKLTNKATAERIINALMYVNSSCKYSANIAIRQAFL